MEPTGIVRTAAMASRSSSERETAVLAYYSTDGLSNARTEAMIIWSPRSAVVDVADEAACARRGRVICSVCLTSPTWPVLSV
jgi:hypothetical protein